MLSSYITVIGTSVGDRVAGLLARSAGLEGRRVGARLVDLIEIMKLY